MKLSIAERLSASLYEPEGKLPQAADASAGATQIVITLLIGAPLLLVWAFVFLYFNEIGAFLGFASYAIFNLAMLAPL